MPDMINVVMVGLPGDMASCAAKKLKDENGIMLNQNALTGNIPENFCKVGNSQFYLIKPDKHEDFLKEITLSGDYKPVIVEFSQAEAVKRNLELYCKYNIPAVIGTTGGKRDMPNADNTGTLEDIVRKSGTCAVIAPNMAKQIVALQAFISDYANTGNTLEGCTLEVIESHQQRKKDSSGTARAMLQYCKKSGILLDTTPVDNLNLEKPEDTIISLGNGSSFKVIRNQKSQGKLGVPKEYLAGHGWHSYILHSNGREHLNKFSGRLASFLINSPAFSGYIQNKNPKNPDNYSTMGNPKWDQRVSDNFFYQARESKNVFELFRISRDKTNGFSMQCVGDDLLMLRHNVNGRDIYAQGSIDPVRFIHKKFYQEGEKGKAYTMIDVSGAGK